MKVIRYLGGVLMRIAHRKCVPDSMVRHLDSHGVPQPSEPVDVEFECCLCDGSIAVGDQWGVVPYCGG